MHYITLHHNTSHHITLHYITSHHITLHYITVHYRFILHVLKISTHTNQVCELKVYKFVGCYQHF